MQPRPPAGRRNLSVEAGGPFAHALTDQPGGNGSVVFAILAVAVHALLLAGWVVGSMMVGARCERVARNWNIRLDELTQFAVGVSRWLNNYWYVLVIVVLPGLVADGTILYLLHRSRRSRSWSYVLAFGVVLLLVSAAGCMGGAFFNTLDRLLEALSR
jgi:hypothetical protein